MTTPFRWVVRLFILTALCFASLSACVAGGDKEPSQPAQSTSSGAVNTSGAGAGDSTLPTTCNEGESRKCHVTLGQHETTISCYVGEQHCVDGAWTTCGNGVTIEKERRSPPTDGDGKPLSLTKDAPCTDNPCDPRCEDWTENGKWVADGSACAWPWSWSFDPATQLAKAKADGSFSEPCTYGSDCQQNTKCQDPSQGNCSHDICSTGAGLKLGCETKCVDKICTAKPQCCEKKYTGNCEVEPCLTYGAGLTKDCDPDVTKVCNWDITCCPYTQWETCYFWGILYYQTVCAWVQSYVCGWQWVYICGWQWVYICGWQWVYVCGWQWQWVCGWVWICDWWSCWWSYQCWWQWVYVCWWEWRYVCWWEWRYVCWWEWQYNCWWQLDYICWQEAVYGWVPYACQKSYPGLWDQHCVDQFKNYAPGKCPMSWPGNWDASCVNAVHDTCHDYCDGVQKGAGKCVEWAAPDYDSKCATFELGVGLTCQNGGTPIIPICNTGSQTAPKGIPIAILPKGSGYFAGAGNTLVGAKYCYTADTIPPGECRNVTTCNVNNGDEVMVNPPANAAYDSTECFKGDDWGHFYNDQCGYPPNCPGGYSDTTKIDSFQTSCAATAEPQWGYLAWDATVPAATEIDFRVRTADTAAGLAAASWFTVSTKATPAAPKCPKGGPSPCPVDLYSLLGVKYAHKPFLDLEITFKVDASKKNSPTLTTWDLTYTCVDKE